MLLKKMLLPMVAGILLYSCSTFHKTAVKKDVPLPAKAGVVSADTSKKSASKVKPYKEIITGKAITDTGLFKVHRIEDKYFFEIADSLLDKDILIVSRISKAAAGNRPQYGYLGYAGDYIGENVVEFSKGPSNKLFIKRMSYLDVSKDSTVNGMYRSVINSNLQPIVAAFDIKAFSPDSAGVVIDVTDYLNGDNDVFFFDPHAKKAYGLSGLQADKSYIGSVQSFPLNLEVRTIKTYTGGDAFFTYELNSSLVLLPGQPMKPRLFDERVGYFATSYKDFDEDPQGVEEKSMITRWRLEPKAEDIDKYQKGVLVEPKKPIVFYIDPATPKRWVPYLMQGVNDWQKAFEGAGFKNAIYALEAPINDPDWSLEDARHNAIIYKPADVPNASGPHVHDPRTGEILETHVNWYHNVMSLIHDWYMVQAGPIDAKARKMEFDDSLMGQLIRFVSSHEVGHTLGLRHNFGSSSTIPVENLRNKKWVEENGFCPSIMDYARFNYVAQPEDSISEKGIFPRIGMYDKWAINWGYRWFPGFKTEKEEKAFFNQWVIAQLNKDKRFWFGSQEITDPRCQSEDIGDNAMKAGYYGIKNLKRMMPELVQWTKEPNTNYESLKRIQDQVINQYNRYLNHVVNNIGGIKWTPKTAEQPGGIISFVSKEQQRAAVQFLQDELFTTPQWIMNKETFSLVGGGGMYLPMGLQQSVLENVMSFRVCTNLFWFQNQEGNKAYTLNELLNDLEAGIWKELKVTQPIDIYRRNLQKVYARQLIEMLETIEYKNKLSPEQARDVILFGRINYTTDVISTVKVHVKELIIRINSVLPIYKDQIIKLHLRDLKDRLQRALYPNTNTEEFKSTSGNTIVDRFGLSPDFGIERHRVGCWEDEGEQN